MQVLRLLLATFQIGYLEFVAVLDDISIKFLIFLVRGKENSFGPKAEVTSVSQTAMLSTPELRLTGFAHGLTFLRLPQVDGKQYPLPLCLLELRLPSFP